MQVIHAYCMLYLYLQIYCKGKREQTFNIRSTFVGYIWVCANINENFAHVSLHRSEALVLYTDLSIKNNIDRKKEPATCFSSPIILTAILQNNNLVRDVSCSHRLDCCSLVYDAMPPHYTVCMCSITIGRLVLHYEFPILQELWRWKTRVNKCRIQEKETPSKETPSWTRCLK